MGRVSDMKSVIHIVCVAATILLACGVRTGAGDTTWQRGAGDPGNWSTDANWTNDEPDSFDIAEIDNGGTALVTDAGEVCQRLRLGVDFGQSGTVNMTAGDLTVHCEEVGYYGTGTFIQSGGVHTVSTSGYLLLGYWTGSSGDYTLTGDGELIAGTLEVGAHGTGVFTQNGANSTVDVSKTLHVGMCFPGPGVYNLVDGQLTAAAEELNFSGGMATFNQSGGTNTVTGDLCMSRRGGGRAEYYLTGGTLTVDGDITGGVGDSRLFLEGGTLDMSAGGSISVRGLYVGADGGAAYTQSGAEDVAVRRNMYVGDYITRATPFTGTYNMNGSGMLSVAGDLFVGARGDGLFNQNSGGVQNIARLILAGRTGIQGTYILDGAASVLSARQEFIGWRGAGVFTQEDGANTVSRMFIGRTRRGNGAYTLNDGQLQSVSAAPPINPGSGRNQYVGYMGAGVFNHNGGANRVDVLRIGFGRGSTGVYTLDSTDPDGDELQARWLFVGHHGAGDFNHINGTSTVGEMRLNGWRAPATYDITGGTLNVGTLIVDGPQAQFTNSGGEVNITGGTTLVVEGDAAFALESGDVNADVEKIGRIGGGTFDQSGGVNTVGRLEVGALEVDSGPLGGPFFTGPFIVGVYKLRGGTLNVTGGLCAHVGYESSGVFEHTDGDHNVMSKLYIGKESGSDGTYELTGGSLTVGDEIRIGADEGLGRLYCRESSVTPVAPKVSFGRKGAIAIGYDFNANDLKNGTLFGGGAVVTGLDQVTVEVTNGATATHNGGEQTYGGLRLGSDDGGGVHEQSGGIVNAGLVGVNGNGEYRFAGGGTLNISNGGLHLAGNMRCYGNTVNIDVGPNSLVHITDAGNLDGVGQTSLYIAPDTLTILPSGFSPGVFHSYENYGRTHTAGSVLNIYGSDHYTFQGHITDPVQVNGAGSIAATPDGRLDLADLQIAGAGTVDLGLGSARMTNTSGWCSMAGGSLSARNEYIGSPSSPPAAFTQTGGTNTVSRALYIGYGAADEGTYTLDGAPDTQLNAGYVVVGYEGRGTFHHGAGTVNAVYDLHVGYKGGSHGEYICWNVTSNLMGGFAVKCATIGYEGEGIFTHEHGNVEIAGDLEIGVKPGGNGTYTIQDGGLRSNGLLVGVDGTGAFDIQGASAVITIADRLSFGPDSTFIAMPGSIIQMEAADFENFNTDAADLTGLSNLTLVFSGGPDDVNYIEVAGEDKGNVPVGWIGNFVVGAVTVTGDGGVNLIDMCANQTGPDVEEEALYLGDLTVAPGSTLGLNELPLYYDGAISQNGTIDLGEGKIGGGAALVNGGTITGAGAIEADVINNSLISPGDSPGTIEIDGDYTQGAGATLLIELGGAGVDDYDRLVISGAATLAGKLDIDLIDLGEGVFPPANGDTFDILDFASVSGEFDPFGPLDLPGLVGRKAWDTSALYSTGIISVTGMLPGDTDADWDVDTDDYNNLIAVFGGAGDWHTDFNEDGLVDLIDFAMMRDYFGTIAGAPVDAKPQAATPEPVTLILLAAGLPLLLKRKRLRRAPISQGTGCCRRTGARR